VFKVNELKAEVVRCGMSVDEFCVKIGMKRRTFARRMQDGNFGLDELRQIKSVLNLSAERMADIFFA
jgi:hypothetical protein